MLTLQGITYIGESVLKYGQCKSSHVDTYSLDNHTWHEKIVGVK